MFDLEKILVSLKKISIFMVLSLFVFIFVIIFMNGLMIRMKFILDLDYG